MEKGLTQLDMVILTIANIVGYPTVRYKSIKTIQENILQKLPVLTQYMLILKQTRDADPILRHTHSMVVTNWHSKSVDDPGSQKKDKTVCNEDSTRTNPMSINKASTLGSENDKLIEEIPNHG